MSSWDPLPPNRVDRWLDAHQGHVYAVLVLVGAAVVGAGVLLGLRHAAGWWLVLVVAVVLSQLGIVHVRMRRTELRMAADRRRRRG